MLSRPFRMSSFREDVFPATTVSIEKAFNASVTDIVPKADDKHHIIENTDKFQGSGGISLT